RRPAPTKSRRHQARSQELPQRSETPTAGACRFAEAPPRGSVPAVVGGARHVRLRDDASEPSKAPTDRPEKSKCRARPADPVETRSLQPLQRKPRHPQKPQVLQLPAARPPR